jgi:ornithine cyclodeaminase/alanine dehydrogenase-like protein (mu-crystallin family)
MQLQTGTDFEAVNHPEQAFEGADFTYEATNSRSPAFDGTKIAPGSHINTISDAVDEATIKKSASHSC